jgi:hypothetical protein
MDKGAARDYKCLYPGIEKSYDKDASQLIGRSIGFNDRFVSPSHTGSISQPKLSFF